MLGGSVINPHDVGSDPIERIESGFTAPGHRVDMEVTRRYDTADTESLVLFIDNIVMKQEDSRSQSAGIFKPAT